MPAQTLIAFLFSCFDIRFWRSYSIIFYRVLHTESNGLRIRNGEGYLCFGMMHCTIHSASYMHPPVTFLMSETFLHRENSLHKSIHSFSKMFCLHSKHSPGFFRLKEMTIYRFLWGRKPQGPKNKNKHLPCCCTITPKCMLMICLSQSIKLSRQNQRFTTQNHEWCIEPMRCCHAVLPHVLVWRTIG